MTAASRRPTRLRARRRRADPLYGSAPATITRRSATTTPYRWAHYADAPFQPLKKPLAQCRVALVTTAAPFDPAKGDQGPARPTMAAPNSTRSIPATPPATHDLRISHVAMTASTPRPRTAAPSFRCRTAAAGGARADRRGRAPLPRRADQPQPSRHPRDRCPEILARCKADDVDAAVLVPNCPVCHQTVSLVARHLEANGIATVVMGCAKDIVEHAGVPRFLFSDFPLGNSAGRPHDRGVAGLHARAGAARAGNRAGGRRPRCSRRCAGARMPRWKLDYCNASALSAEELARRRREFDAQKEIARGLRESAANSLTVVQRRHVIAPARLPCG